MSSYVSKQIEKISEELTSLREELDSIDCTHYGRYSALLQKIAEKTSRIEALKALNEKTTSKIQAAFSL